MASVHFALHEAHCLRFLVLCPECEEPIPKSKMKEHAEAVHQQVSRWQSGQRPGVRSWSPVLPGPVGKSFRPSVSDLSLGREKAFVCVATLRLPHFFPFLLSAVGLPAWQGKGSILRKAKHPLENCKEEADGPSSVFFPTFLNQSLLWLYLRIKLRQSFRFKLVQQTNTF